MAESAPAPAPPKVLFPASDEAVVITAILPTHPFPPAPARAHVSTERLLIRPFVADDIGAMHVLRTQPEVMINTAVGKIDPDVATTQSRLDLFLPPNDVKQVNCALCLRETGGLIGMGGSHNFQGGSGWPELGYVSRNLVPL